MELREIITLRPLVMQRNGGWSFFYTHEMRPRRRRRVARRSAATEPRSGRKRPRNKNVSDVVSFQQARGVPAHYEYAPFGEVTVSATNTAFTAFNVATTNPYRFSSEYADDELGLVYYNYRHYEPIIGRWCCVEPFPDYMALSTYTIGNNDVMNTGDILGLKIRVDNKNSDGIKELLGQLFGDISLDDSGYLVVNTNNCNLGCECLKLINCKPTYTIHIDDDKVSLYGGGAFEPLEFHCGGDVFIGSKKEYDQGNELEINWRFPFIQTKRNVKSQVDILAHELGHAMTHQNKLKYADRRLWSGDPNKKRLEEEAKKYEKLIRNICHETK